MIWTTERTGLGFGGIARSRQPKLYDAEVTDGEILVGVAHPRDGVLAALEDALTEGAKGVSSGSESSLPTCRRARDVSRQPALRQNRVSLQKIHLTVNSWPSLR